MSDWRQRLTDPATFLASVDRLLLRRTDRERLVDDAVNVAPDRVSLVDLGQGRERFARELARDIAAGTWRPGAYRRTEVIVGDKKRTLYLPGVIDHVVSGAVGDVLLAAAEPRLSPFLYSYRPGMGPQDGVRRFAELARTHIRDVADVKKRGLFVARRDVKAFAESVPVGPRAPLWDALARQLDPTMDPARVRAHPLWFVVESSVRPLIANPPHQHAVGLPLGAPVNTGVFNIYLMPADDALGKLPGVFYARYGDDVLIASPEPAPVRAAANTLDEILASLQLSASPTKSRDLYLTMAGRQPLHDDSGPWQGAQDVEYLGLAVSADGVVGLKRKHVRRIVRELERRTTSVARALAGEPLDVIGVAACAAVGHAFELRSPLVLPDARRLLHVVTDRRQLAWLDHQIARLVASAVTGEPRASAWRRASWQHMRKAWRLPSVVALRNDVTARGRA